MSSLLKQFEESSSLYGGNAHFIEYLYEQYLSNPESISPSWRQRFDHIRSGATEDTPHSVIVERFEKLAIAEPGRLARMQGFTEQSVKKQSAVARLINHYRVKGHQIAANNPLGQTQSIPADLEPIYYGLTDADMSTMFDTGGLCGVDRLPLKAIIQTLNEIYCGSIGSEYMHIVDDEKKRWIKDKLEGAKPDFSSHPEKRQWLLKLLIAAEGLEKFLHRKYVGQKRFSLEGGESLIPVLDELIQRAGEHKGKEIVIGMAHRGRLNVLINILGKSPAVLFGEFEGTHTSSPGVLTGDVKYHQGFSSNIATPGGPIHLTLAFNPSHLEIINPVVEGSVKARQDRHGVDGFEAILPILIHGDAAFAGQGIVMETLNMSETRAFSTGGTVHIVINNQIGFTTSNPFDARSTLYCTDVANMIQAPVFHVNGDDPEAVIFVTQLALDYRNTFHKDVVIDLICYRRHGHNEADEPATTQPMMYKSIRDHLTPPQIYAQKLIAEGVVTEDLVQKMEQDYQQLLNEGQPVSRPIIENNIYSYSARWVPYQNKHWDTPADTSITLGHIRFCNQRLQCLPEGFELHPRVAKVMEDRNKMATGEIPMDWGFAENLAYATLLLDKYNMRLTGQDIGRGTFSHRHAILLNQANGENYIPLKYLSETQGRAQIFNSLLSEAGVLGFEYGYSSTEPNKLVIWEAQFGDFANGAQVVIDQFIASGETKWGKLSGLVMLLPHGFEGQGPEHSSARLERYLQLCADHNIQVCVPTTPAQIFHLLRRQMLRQYRKPLIIMSPKSLLRHKLAVSTLTDLTHGEFLNVIGEQDDIDPYHVTRIVLCAGKVYFDLLEARRLDQEQLRHVAIIRIEQLYPFPNEQFKREIDKYPNIEHIVWCQEEPKNQGAWYQSKHHFFDLLDKNIPINYAGRVASAAPAVGSYKTHLNEQRAVVNAALYGSNEGTTHEL
ncbi:2-oxoglutarate dehydrogenase E1 component (EC 1.2.4.2) [Methylomonas albis]|uniref:oxoglutarate dehydrogenase (succinyl-transferring) n=1 Tax=Methylomonas albis TaxID=1854563 RepID=A0ABR9CYD0_9GAMM|nr:2-oxoglutarate dehydrogenase E1 component [Methylomonas albis]MBD9355891.1 2-oxoglutarate dehydrogenase E1 component [Methylomonas albis]CAD6878921.1 2-oxoglutarate dehydrogenase E1 component (EC 1.2.4.2) [Methylomonas albis]